LTKETIEKRTRKGGKAKVNKDDAKTIPVNVGGRPEIHIDTQKLFIAAQGFLPVEGLARLFDCSADTLYNKYFDILQKAREERKQSLLLVMWEKALIHKDTTMMIWMSKQHLGFKDRQPEEAQIINFNVVVNEVPK
jgi:hypothetical protein